MHCARIPQESLYVIHIPKEPRGSLTVYRPYLLPSVMKGRHTGEDSAVGKPELRTERKQIVRARAPYHSGE